MTYFKLAASIALIVFGFWLSVGYALLGCAVALVEISAGVDTWLGQLNFLVLQWFGVRLARVMATEGLDHRITNAFVVPGGGISVSGTARPGREVQIGWTVLRWVWPLTGWWGDYRYIARRP